MTIHKAPVGISIQRRHCQCDGTRVGENRKKEALSNMKPGRIRHWGTGGGVGGWWCKKMSRLDRNKERGKQAK